MMGIDRMLTAMAAAVALAPTTMGQAAARDVAEERAVRARAVALQPAVARVLGAPDVETIEDPGGPWRGRFDELDAAARAGTRRALPADLDPAQSRPELLALWMTVAELPRTEDLVDFLRIGFLSPHAVVRDAAVMRLEEELLARPDLRAYPRALFDGEPTAPVRALVADARARAGLALGAAPGYVADEPVLDGNGGDRRLPMVTLMHGPLDAAAIEVLGEGPLAGTPELAALALVARARDGAEVVLDEGLALDYILRGRDEALDEPGSSGAERLVALLARKAPMDWLRGLQWELLVEAGAREDPWAARAAGALAFTYGDLEDGLDLEPSLALAFIEGFEAHRERPLRDGGAAAGLLVWADEADAPNLAGVARRMLIRRMVHGGEALIAVALPVLLLDVDLQDPAREEAITDIFGALADTASGDPAADEEHEIGDSLGWILDGVTPELRDRLLGRIPRGHPIQALRGTLVDLAWGEGAERDAALELLSRFEGDPEVVALLQEQLGTTVSAFEEACARAAPIGARLTSGGELLWLDGELVRIAEALVAVGDEDGRAAVHGALSRTMEALRAAGAEDWSDLGRAARPEFPPAALAAMAPAPGAADWLASWMRDDLCARVREGAALELLGLVRAERDVATEVRAEAAALLLERFDTFSAKRRARALAALASAEPTAGIRAVAGRALDGDFGFGAVLPGADLLVQASAPGVVAARMEAALAEPAAATEVQLEVAGALAEALRRRPARAPFDALLRWHERAAGADGAAPDAIDYLEEIRGHLLGAIARHPEAAARTDLVARAILAGPLAASADGQAERLAGTDVHGWRLPFERDLAAFGAFAGQIPDGGRRAFAAYPGASARLDGRVLLALAGAAGAAGDVELALALTLAADIARRGERASHDSPHFCVRLTARVMELLERANGDVDPGIRRAAGVLLARLAVEVRRSPAHCRLMGVALRGLTIDFPEDAAAAVTLAAARHSGAGGVAQVAWRNALERCAPAASR